MSSLQQWRDAVRLFNTALALLCLTATTVANAADDATTSDEAQASLDAEEGCQLG
jgi:hypothetical protein